MKSKKPWEAQPSSLHTYAVVWVNSMSDWYRGKLDAYGEDMAHAFSTRYRDEVAALQACAKLCDYGETMRVIEIPPGETLDYDGTIVAEVRRGRLG